MARKLASHCSIIGSERLYVAGLLHDIGSLLLYSHYPDLASEVLMIANGDEEVMYEAENDFIGFNHAMVGAELLKLWNMPESLITAVEYHHEPALAESHTIDAAIVHLAGYAANLNNSSSFVEQPTASPSPLDPRVWDITQLNEQIIDESIGNLDQELSIAMSVMMPSSSVA